MREGLLGTSGHKILVHSRTGTNTNTKTLVKLDIVTSCSWNAVNRLPAGIIPQECDVGLQKYTKMSKTCEQSKPKL